LGGWGWGVWLTILTRGFKLIKSLFGRVIVSQKKGEIRENHDLVSSASCKKKQLQPMKKHNKCPVKKGLNEMPHKK
jgi:hypothetical protein